VRALDGEQLGRPVRVRAPHDPGPVGGLAQALGITADQNGLHIPARELGDDQSAGETARAVNRDLHANLLEQQGECRVPSHQEPCSSWRISWAVLTLAAHEAGHHTPA
jgi:hypothetical protein